MNSVVDGGNDDFRIDNAGPTNVQVDRNSEDPGRFRLCCQTPASYESHTHAAQGDSAQSNASFKLPKARRSCRRPSSVTSRQRIVPWFNCSPSDLVTPRQRTDAEGVRPSGERPPTFNRHALQCSRIRRSSLVVESRVMIRRDTQHQQLAFGITKENSAASCASWRVRYWPTREGATRALVSSGWGPLDIRAAHGISHNSSQTPVARPSTRRMPQSLTGSVELRVRQLHRRGRAPAARTARSGRVAASQLDPGPEATRRVVACVGSIVAR
ncbi:hypothetical protein B0H10DRAFT_1941395 [Mycena sp. CBHHK59/15]|nr:hypothetical protein B0H10DRAFT_1941395 [Mycena sp. CBHHK59/15]